MRIFSPFTHLPTLFFICLTTLISAQGPLTPPGPPAPNMKTLDQIEPRTPLKSADFPLTITAAGSYYLTENVNVIASSASGINVNSNNVTIDLGGFTLSGNGINGIICLANATNITIANGGVLGWTSNGIDLSLGRNCKVIGVTTWNSGNLADNSTAGIKGGAACIVENCTSRGNAGSGIVAGAYSTVSHCTASDNVQDGIFAGESSAIDYCAANNNSFFGIQANSGSTMTACASSHNTVIGILVSSGCTVIGCVASFNTSAGFEIDFACNVTNCSAYANGGDGFILNAVSRFTNNVSSSNSSNGYLTEGDHNVIEGNSAFDNGMFGFNINFNSNLTVKNTALRNTSGGFTFFGPQYSGVIISTSGVISADPWANFAF